MYGALMFVFLIIVIFLFACVVLLMFQNFQPIYWVDMKELRDIDPTIKRFYKRYWVDKIVAAAVSRFNDIVVQYDIPHKLKKNEKRISALADVIARQISTAPARIFLPILLERFSDENDIMENLDTTENGGATLKSLYRDVVMGMRDIIGSA